MESITFFQILLWIGIDVKKDYVFLTFESETPIETKFGSVPANQYL